MAGASRTEELIGRSVPDWTAPECIAENDAAVQLCLKQGHISDFETTYLRADGSRARILINATTEDSPEGRKIVTLCRNITERKKAEEAADRANQEWERTFNAISDLVMVLDDQHKILRANKAMADALGMTEQALIGRLCFELVHGEKEPPVFCPHSQLLTDGEEHSAEVVEPRLGGIYDVRVSPLVGQNGQVIGSVHVTRDITERKLAGERLLLLNFALDHVRDAAYLIDENSRFLYVNDEACRALSYNREELLGGMSVLDIGPGWTEERWTGHWHELKASGSLTFEAFHKARDGHVFPVEITANIFHYHGADYNVALARDITERKLTERELQRSNDLLRAIIEAAPTAIIGLDLDGNVRTVWNPAAEKMLGWSADEAMGRPLPSVPVESQEEFRGFRERIRSGKTLDGVEVRRQKRDGTPIDYSIYASPLHDTEGRITGNICVLVDITERKQAEQEKEKLQAQLLQAQKMEAIGTLAGGIAHDFNNLLQVVLGYSDILLFDKKPSDPDYERLHAIRQAGRHGSELANRILAFSRRLEPNAHPVNLNNEIRRVQKMLERTVPKMIRIEILLADNLMTVNADPGQMEQILLNLAVNAQHAMPDGGRLTIETANVTLDEDYSRTHLDAEPGKYVLLTVSDTGHGMDKEVVEHIFEPFYMTKGPGEGTGLGLAMVFGIVKSHKGHISCYSEPGSGTTFRIYLPAIVQEIEQDVPVTQQMPAFGTETILLVDDEKSIRKLGEQMLRMAGYRVLTATNGREALEVYRSNQAKIALVLLDLMMPEMGGKQCLEELLKINPRVKVVIASGYSPNGPTKEALTSGAKGFVNKPYDIRQVLEVVRAVLDEEQGRPQVSD